MTDGCHFEIVKAPYINLKLSDFDEIWCGEANSDKDGHAFHQNSVLAISQSEVAYFGQILCKDEQSHTHYGHVTKISNF